MKITFEELTYQLNLIDNLIMSEIINEEDDDDTNLSFSKHLISTRHWFTRISNSNKQRYMHALITNISSVWVLSLVLKCIWSSRTKDAVMSVSDKIPYSGYDISPMDNNRTAQSLDTLSKVMKTDRKWFVSLTPDLQSMVLCDLLSIAGGPVVWSVYKKSLRIYNRHQSNLIRNIETSIPLRTSKQVITIPLNKNPVVKNSIAQDPQLTLQTNLIQWSSKMKAMRESLKIQQTELLFKNGEKKEIWQVNREKPELTETVDLLQMLPSNVGKMILAYLPTNSLIECAKVNRYWAYLIDELKTELVARHKINEEIRKLRDIVAAHSDDLDTSSELSSIESLGQGTMPFRSTCRQKSYYSESLHASEATGVSFRFFLRRYSDTSNLITKPISNLREIVDRLERRGAADEKLWKWCEKILGINKKAQIKEVKVKKPSMDETHFPCPLLRMRVKIPLKAPLRKDPSFKTRRHNQMKRVISNSTIISFPRKPKKIKLWTKDLSSLFPVSKIPSYFCDYRS